MPKELQMNKNLKFKSKISKNILEKNNIKEIHSISYYPHSQQICKRLNRIIKEKLKLMENLKKIGNKEFIDKIENVVFIIIIFNIRLQE